MQIEIKNLLKKYKNETVLNIEEFSINKINTLAIVGPSGGGKSTLLKILATIEEADSGSLKVNGEEIVNMKDHKEYLNHVGFVFQNNNLFPNLTVLENVTIHLIYTYKINEKEAISVAEKWLDKVGILEHKNKKVDEISGGQAQRAAIVRALVSGAKLLMLDEPTSALDPELAYEVMTTLMKVKEEADIIAVTHELNFARRFADYYIFVEDGKILEHGPIEGLFNSDSSRVVEFVNKIEFK